MTKDKLVCTWAWRENEGDANKNYFVSLGSALAQPRTNLLYSLGFAAWIVQELYCFLPFFLSHIWGLPLWMRFMISWMSSSVRSSSPKQESLASVKWLGVNRLRNMRRRFSLCHASSKNQPMRVQKRVVMMRLFIYSFSNCSYGLGLEINSPVSELTIPTVFWKFLLRSPCNFHTFWRVDIP